MKSRIEAQDVVIRKVEAREYPELSRLYLLVTNALCITAWWPNLAYYQGSWWEWEGNEFMPQGIDATSYFGHGCYKQLDPMTFIDADMRDALNLEGK
jgi:hypothetical protein